MSTQSRKSLAGATRVSLLALLSISVAAAIFLFVHRADAQANAASQPKTVAYGPVELVGAGLAGMYEYELDAFTPDTSSAATPFRVHIATPDGDATFPIASSGPTFHQYSIYMINYTTGNVIFVFDNLSLHGVTHINVPASHTQDPIAIRLLPAVKTNGTEVGPLSTSVMAFGDSYIDPSQELQFTVSPTDIR